MPLNTPITLIILLSIIGVWIVLRKFVFNSLKSVALPASAPRGSKVSRWIEMLILICVAGIIFVFTATNGSTGGRLLILDELGPAFAKANLTVAIGAGIGLLLSAVLCYCRRTSIATILAAIVLIVYATFLNGPEKFLETLAGEKGGERKVPWTICIGGCDVQGAELWVNGIQLGTLPYTTTMEEFKAKVPFWDTPPAEMENDEDHLKIPDYSPYFKPGWSGAWRKWAIIVMPGEHVKYWDSHRSNNEEDEKKRTYYAQIKYGGEWGYSNGRGTGGSGSRYIYRARSSIDSVRFPEREQRMEALFDKARLADYKPSDEWFDAIETFGDDGILAIYRIISVEPQMDAVLTQWARYKYNLDRVVNEATAWKAFENICDEADRERIYSTAGVAGKAVELLIPQLNPDTLAKKANKLICWDASYQWNFSNVDSQKHFGYSEHPTSLMGGYQGYGSGSYTYPMHVYAVAHAVWKMDEYLDRQDPVGENIIEQKVVPAYVAQNYHHIHRLKLALHVGSKALDRYLLRQNWRADADNLPWGQQFSSFGDDINGWVYLLSNIDSPAGRKFRKEQRDRVFGLADSLLEDSHGFNWDTELDFLFLDLDMGQKSLAWQYWPRYRTKVKKAFRPLDKLKFQFEYLSRMEPYSTAQMYVDCFLQFKGDKIDLSQAFSRFKGTIPEEKRLRTCQAFVNEIDRIVNNIEMGTHDTPERIKSSIAGSIKSFGKKEDTIAEAQSILDDLHNQGKKTSVKPKYVKPWLANTVPDHPLMSMLANDEDPALRVLILDAIVAHPTPQNRKLLEKLLNDFDATVKQAAEEASAKLKQLRDRPLSELAAYPTEKEQK